MKKTQFCLLSIFLLFFSCANEVGGDKSPSNNSNTNIEDKTPPSEVKNVTVESGNQHVLLSWLNPNDSDFYATTILFTPLEESVNQPIIVEGNKSSTSSHVIKDLKNGTTYTFTLTAIDTNGNESKSISIQTTPQNKLIDSVYLPNDNEKTIVLSSNEAPINIRFTEGEEIKKAILKKGQYNIKPDISALLDNPLSTNFTITNGIGSIIVNENGFYDIIVQNSNNDIDWIQTEIKTIDNTPITEVENFNSSCDGEYVYITWKDSVHENEYDSTLKQLIISYTYNDDNSDTDNGNFVVNPGTESASIKISEQKKVLVLCELQLRPLMNLIILVMGKVLQNTVIVI